ncbi:MAG: hypothetical protein U0264_18390 [Candidatus Kapaibacterium sp.]
MIRSLLSAAVLAAFLLLGAYRAEAQVENVQVVHPVYQFLLHAETRGLLEHFTLSSLPLQRSEIMNALRQIRSHEKELLSSELSTLALYEREFELQKRGTAVMIYSKTDSTQLFSERLVSNDEKMLYRYADTAHSVRAYLIGGGDMLFQKQGDSTMKNVAKAQGGFRVFGTLSNCFGYYIQVTNGTVLSGERALALEDPRIRQNIKFTTLDSDFDFTESHVQFQQDWFLASVGREVRLHGAGFFQRSLLSNTSPPIDAFSVAAKFQNVEYKFIHGSLLGVQLDSSGRPVPTFGHWAEVGAFLQLPPKYVAIHQLTFKPTWGEFGLWESLIYSNRGIDVAYLNPLSFLKSVEHSLRDRDNSAIGAWASVRPFKNLQIKGSYFLDDLVFSLIGTDYWSNKAAFNIGAQYSTPLGIDAALEYAKVFPYTFSHFNVQNATTNDGLQMLGYLAPNSDEVSLHLNWWRGNRYPFSLIIASRRHGDNIMGKAADGSDSTLVNVGGSVLLANRYGIDSANAPFLAGQRNDVFVVQFSGGIEVIRGFNIQLNYRLEQMNSTTKHTAAFTFRFDDF